MIEEYLLFLGIGLGIGIITTLFARKDRKSFPDMLMELQDKADHYKAEIRAIERLLEANNEIKREANRNNK